jgi:hypothetical protein
MLALLQLAALPLATPPLPLLPLAAPDVSSQPGRAADG